jgi:hypothetical protein
MMMVEATKTRDGNIPRSPWTKRGLSALKLNCGFTGNIVRPRSTETPSRTNRPPGRCRPQSTPRWNAPARANFDHHGGEQSTPGSYIEPSRAHCAQLSFPWAVLGRSETFEALRNSECIDKCVECAAVQE